MVRHDVNQETGNPRALTEALRLVRERSAEDDSVLILAAAEPDGVCSAHILTSIFKLESIRYTLQSVKGYTELDAVLKALRPSVRTVFLLNCGAAVNLTSYLDTLLDVVLIVVDSHRPIHLKNVKEAARILVLDDDLGRGSEFPVQAMDEADEGGDGDDDDLIEDIIFLQEDDEHDEGMRKRHKSGEDEERRAARRKVLRDYYEGFYYASPSALVLYAMASDMGYQNQQLLWLASVGLASYLESGYFSQDTFRGIAQDMDNHHLSPQGSAGLKFVQDLSLCMYRHWSLFQAMWHTPYVFSKLELHRDHGHGTMQKLLMYAGVAPDNYNQNFSSMSHSAKKLVSSDLFKKKCAAFGLDDIKHYQFVRSLRIKDEQRPSLMLNELSASDLYYMICSALHLKGFNHAMDVAVCSAPLSEMHACISRCLDVHKDICTQAKMILDKRGWRMVDGFRFAVIEKPTSQIFQQSPHAVRWLAMFLMNVLHQRKHSAPLMALLICVRHGMDYICLGADPQDTKSELVFRFRNACEATAVKIKLDSFDFALAEVPSADFETWANALLGGSSEEDDYDSDEDEEEEEGDEVYEQDENVEELNE